MKYKIDNITSMQIPAQLTDWSPENFDFANEKLRKFFVNKILRNHRNEVIYFNYDLDFLDNIFGLPYVSSSCFPLLVMDCNTHIYLDEYFYFEYCYISKEGNLIIALTDSKDNNQYITLFKD